MPPKKGKKAIASNPSPSSSASLDVEDIMEKMQKTLNLARAEVAGRKAGRKETRATCSYCSKQEGTQKMPFCSRCKSVVYCCKEHQALHWKQGHKRDCINFAQPPVALSFDVTSRAADGHHVHPIFAKEVTKGVGMWVSVNGRDISGRLCEPYQRANDREGPISFATASPAYHKWLHKHCDIQKPTLESKRYMGSILLSLKVMVQNRRQDGLAVKVNGSDFRLVCHESMIATQTDEEKPHISWKDMDDGRRFLILKPWVDYAGESRLALTEINRTLAPCTEYKTVNVGRGIKAAREYGPTPHPSEGVWKKVQDWDKSLVELQPGDYAVWEMQFRCGDPATEIVDEAQVVEQLTALYCNNTLTREAISSTLSSIPEPNSVAEFQSILDEIPSIIERAKGDSQLIWADFDRPAVENYYKVYWEKGPDAFARSRSGRAEAADDVLASTMPALMNLTMASMTEENKKKFRDRLAGMGLNPDLVMNLGA